MAITHFTSPARRFRAVRLLVFFILAAAIAIFVSLWRQVPGFSIRNHSFHLEFLPFLLTLAAALFLLLALWALGVRGRSKPDRGEDLLAGDFPTYLPIAWLLLAPLALGHYLTRDDLAQRLGLWAVAVMAAVVYLKAVRIVQADKSGKSKWGNRLDAFLAWPLRRRLIVLAATAMLLSQGSVLLMTGQGKAFGGDEPHYLLIAHSLAKDGDLDLANNYRDGDFKAFMPPQVSVLQPHTAPVNKAGVLYSFHSPGIAFLLLPFYALGLALGKGMLVFLVRFGMSLVGAFLGIQLYLYARDTWKRERLAFAFWAVVALSSPIFFYATHIYTELAVAALSVFVFRRLRSARSLDAKRLALTGVLLASFIWFHAMKYLFIQAPFFIFALWSVWKGSEARDRGLRLVAFFVPAGLCLAAYFAFQHAIYGSFSLTSISFQGAMNGRQTVGFLKDLLAGTSFRVRWETLAGYFLDQKDGLLLYAPVYAFAFVGMLAMLRARSRDAGWLLFIAGPYVLISAFLTQRTGYAPQARPLVPVIWVLAIFVAGCMAESGSRLCRTLFTGAAGLSFLATWLLCRNPFALYQETTFGISERAGDLFVALSNLHFYLPSYLPSFIKIEGGRWHANGFWILALVVFCIACFIRRAPGRGLTFAGHAAVASFLLLVFFVWIVCFPRPVLGTARAVAMPSGEKWLFFPYSLVAHMEAPGNFALFQDDRDYDFFFATRSPLDKLEVEFGSVHGVYALQMTTADDPAFAATTRWQLLTRTIASPPAYAWKGFRLYSITIRLERESDVRTGVTPYRFALSRGR